jgi:hypothetical protein
VLVNLPRPHGNAWGAAAASCALKAAGRPAWFEPASVLGELGLEDTAEGRRHYAEGMRARAVAELAGAGAGCATRAELRRGWCLGGESFRERMLRLLAATAEKLPRGRAAVDATVRRSHGEEEARHILRAGSELFGLDTEALRTLKKGETRKAAIAALIRERTAVPNAWIARELHLGHFSRVSHCVRRAEMQPQFKDQLARYLRNRARF